jgi:hypothetical protein
MPGAGRTRSRGWKRKNHTRIVTTGKAETSGTPCAMVFAAAPCSPWCTGLFSHHPPGLFDPGVDPSVGGSGPHGLTVREAPHVLRLNAPIASRTDES